MGTDHDEPSDIGMVLLADAPEPLFSSGRVLSRHKPEPSRNCRPDSKSNGIRNGSRYCGRGDWTNYGNCLKASAQFVRTMPDMDFAIEFTDLLLHLAQLEEKGKEGTGQAVESCRVMRPRPVRPACSRRGHPDG